MFMELLWDLSPYTTPKFLNGSGDLWDAHVERESSPSFSEI